jgi:hypothetical protein
MHVMSVIVIVMFVFVFVLVLVPVMIVLFVIVLVVIVMFVLVDDEIRPCGSDPAALHPLKKQRVVADSEASDSSGDLIWISPGIHQGRQCHVARYSGSALEPRHSTPSTGEITL